MKFSSIIVPFLTLSIASAHASPSSSSKSSKASKASKKTQKYAATSSDVTRDVFQARATLENVDIDQATPAEIIFFEDALQNALQDVLDGDKHSVRSVMVTDQDDDGDKKKKKKRGGDRMLRGDRALYSYWGRWAWYGLRWFDIFAHVEFYGCSFCYDDGDDWYYDDDDDDRYNYRRRGLEEQDNQNQVAESLCNELRDGPHDRLKIVSNCIVEFSPQE